MGSHMQVQPHAETLFHLVPTNLVAEEALQHPDNRRFVSTSEEGRFGLEVGFHVPSTARGHVITRLGRNADIILRSSTPSNPMSAVHVAFEFHPATELVRLSVRSKRLASVEFGILHTQGNAASNRAEMGKITGDGVILYGQNYRLIIEHYTFNLVWKHFSQDLGANTESLRALAVRGYYTSLQRVQNVRSRDRPTEYDHSEALSWHITRLSTTKDAPLQDIKALRTILGKGSFGMVYEAVDRVTGNTFAVKVVSLERNADDAQAQAARACLHREIKVMQRLKHKHIIEYLGHQLLDTLKPEIFMPRRKGNLKSLAEERDLPMTHQDLIFQVAEQMLSALDYLECQGSLIHRDIKPENILYSPEGEKNYLFQLADFGLANYLTLATTFCGTGHYQAPELYPGVSGIDAPQSHKMDVWSLVATLVAVHPATDFPPKTPTSYAVILRTLVRYASESIFEPMGRENPARRASAAQMLVKLFDGRGLTTPLSRVPPIPPPENQVPAAHVVSNHGRPGSRDRVHNTRQQARRTPRVQPLITYPPELRTARRNPQRALQPRPNGVRGGGISKRQGEPRQSQRTPVYDYRMDLN
ncbi:protein kinase, catalytic domain-containing protein [Pochonia chlamydosporia 170]|uniref:non-specific serine/threonine protein kinase n=1 Tax=Pochonia chlamydosporia 170 TaxID=1380566 RepID=A0A179F8F6_METCM|nr:protein kinase, catalytic domain-containing protein [Pochonia chlamydosporia 170]OAQ61561.1 protein kinase, catalytic domain-containing protein [Pochonia chlamydosporia 170]